MIFAGSGYAWAFLVVVGITLLLLHAQKRRTRLLARFAPGGLAERLFVRFSRRRKRLRAGLTVLGSLFAFFALLQPQWGYRWQEVQRRGVDILVALDTSKSMLADDVKPSRLERAKREVEDLLTLLEGDRIGLMAFSGSPFIVCPLTLDYAACRMFLDDIQVGAVPRGGTDIGKAIRKALQSFEEVEARYNILILITDGEDHGGRALAAAKEAAERGVRIYTIGLGSPEGQVLKVGEEFLKDASGQAVLSRLDEKALQEIALVTGGAYVLSRPDSRDLEEIYTERIARLSGRKIEERRKKVWENRFQWPLFIALFLLAAAPWIREGKRR